MTFTTDWFSGNLPTWEAIVAPHLRSIDVPSVLEIGAFEGRASCWFLSNFPTLLLTVIDPWAFTDGADSDTFERFKANTLPYNDRLVVLRETSQCLRMVWGSFHVIYVDGAHNSCSVMHDAVLSYALLRPGGLLIFDDYGAGDGVAFPRPAIDLFDAAYGQQGKIERVSDGYQRIYRKLTPAP